MAAGGMDDRCPATRRDCQVIAVGVVVDQARGDRFRLCLARPGVGGQDLHAWFELGDRHCCAASEQNSGSRGEAAAAARCGSSVGNIPTAFYPPSDGLDDISDRDDTEEDGGGTFEALFDLLWGGAGCSAFAGAGA